MESISNEEYLSYSLSKKSKLTSGLREESFEINIDFLGNEVVNNISDIKKRINEYVDGYDFTFNGHINELVKKIREITNFMSEDHFNAYLVRKSVGKDFYEPYYEIYEEYESTNGKMNSCKFQSSHYNEYEKVNYDSKKITVKKSDGIKDFYDDPFCTPKNIINELNEKFKRLIELKENQRKYKKIRTLRNVYKKN